MRRVGGFSYPWMLPWSHGLPGTQSPWEVETFLYAEQGPEEAS